MSILLQMTLVLLTALLIVPLVKLFKLPSVLGYVLTGIVLGPSVLSLFSDTTLYKAFVDVSMICILFWVGLQLRPARLSQIQTPIWIATCILVLGSSAVFTGLASLFLQQNLIASAVLGLAASLSALTLINQHLQLKDKLTTTYGQFTYSVLIIQALFSIPLIAAVPLFSGVTSTEHGVAYFAAIMATFTGLFLSNRYLMQPLYQWIAKSSSQELHGFVTLFVVLGLLLLTQTLGLPLYLGALFAGVLLADSNFRTAVETSIQPFKGLLIGLCFISLGLTIHISDLIVLPGLIIGGAFLIVLIKFMLMFAAVRYYQYSWRNTSFIAANLAQCGEFAFIVLSIAVSSQIIAPDVRSICLLMIALSMLMTPLLYWLLDAQILPRLDRQNHLIAHLDTTAETQLPTDTLLIGFGRFGQIVARILQQQQVPFSVMDSNITATELLNNYHIQFYQADATAPEALHAADIAHKQYVIVAIDDIEDSMLVVRHLTWNYPNLKLWVRARDRHHAQLLRELGIVHIFRETYASALELSEAFLKKSDLEKQNVTEMIQVFRHHDEDLFNTEQYVVEPSTTHPSLHQQTLNELAYLFEQDQRHNDVSKPTKPQVDTNSAEIATRTDDLS